MSLIRYFWDAVVAMNPTRRRSTKGGSFSLCNAGQLHSLFIHAGLLGVETRSIDVPTAFSDFADYWTPFLSGQGPAPGYVMSLDPHRRDALRDRIRAKLPVAADGTISLTARAWAVRGGKPAH
jgi:hypothetical protein